MSTGGQKKTRLERVAALELPPNLFDHMLRGLQRIDVLARIGLCVVAAVAMWLIVGGWEPPFSYRTGFVPQRDILARVEFREFDPVATKTAKDKAANQVRFVYQQDSSALVQLRAALINKLAEVSNSATLGRAAAGSVGGVLAAADAQRGTAYQRTAGSAVPAVSCGAGRSGKACQG